MDVLMVFNGLTSAYQTSECHVSCVSFKGVQSIYESGSWETTGIPLKEPWGLTERFENHCPSPNSCKQSFIKRPSSKYRFALFLKTDFGNSIRFPHGAFGKFSGYSGSYHKNIFPNILFSFSYFKHIPSKTLLLPVIPVALFLLGRYHLWGWTVTIGCPFSPASAFRSSC